MDKSKLTEEFIYKCEKQRKKNEKKLKPLTQDDIMKYEIAEELGLLDKVDERDGQVLLLRKQDELVESLHHEKNN